jgi:hypothetical protein
LSKAIESAALRCAPSFYFGVGADFTNSNGRNDETNFTASARGAYVGFIRILGAGAATTTLVGAGVAAIAAHAPLQSVRKMTADHKLR